MSDREREAQKYRIGMAIKLGLTVLALIGWLIELGKLGAF